MPPKDDFLSIHRARFKAMTRQQRLEACGDAGLIRKPSTFTGSPNPTINQTIKAGKQGPRPVPEPEDIEEGCNDFLRIIPGHLHDHSNDARLLAYFTPSAAWKGER